MKNKFINIILCCIILAGCKEIMEENNPPYTPSSTYPADSATGIPLNVTLRWTGGDPDGDVVFYTLFFDTTTPLSKVFSNRKDTLTYTPESLVYNTTYYWKIVAKDSAGLSTSGPVWVFTTDTSKNLPPYIPNNPSPMDSALRQKVNTTLMWQGGDPDSGDVVKYDIYFDTLDGSLLKTSAHSSTTYNPGVLEFATRYYWKIVASDLEGASSSSKVWTFTTEDTMVIKNILAAPGSEPMGIAWSGTHLWVSDSMKGKIYCIDTASAGVVKSFQAPDSAPTGLTWDGTNLWVSGSSSRVIYKITVDGAVIDSFMSQDSLPMGLAWRNSSSLWLCGSASGRIYEINPITGNEIRSFPSPATAPKGLAFYQEYLWVCSPDRIYKVNTASGLSEQSFKAPAGASTGLAWDNQYLWCSDAITEKIYRLEWLIAQ